MSFDRDQFEQDKQNNATAMAGDSALQRKALDLVTHADTHGYGYQWTWLDLPVIQMPQDIVAVQEILWRTRPDVVIETGIAWGGSIVLYASILELIGNGRVVGVDLVLPQKNIDAIMKYRFSERITLYQGSSVDPDTVARVKSHINDGDKVMVLLDSNHTHEHVLEELRLYAPLVTKDQYLIVSDTIVEDIPVQTHRPRPWGPGNNPKTALEQYLTETDRFEEDRYINDKLLLTFSPSGYVRCVR